MGPGDDKVRKPKPPTFEDIGLKPQMSQFYALNATMEQLFGQPMYMA